MANEIWHSYDSASTLYALVYRPSDGYIYDVGDAAFEAVGTWNDARVGECDIAMSTAGGSDIHLADFPTVAAAVYLVQIRLRVGGSPDTDDPPIAQGFMNWDGTAEINASTLDALIDIIDTNVDTLITDGGKVLNIYDETGEPEPVEESTVEA